MEAIFKFPSSEFNEELFNKIAALLKGRSAEITIALHDKIEFKGETSEQYWDRLSNSVVDINEGKGITLTMEELDELINK